MGKMPAYGPDSPSIGVVFCPKVTADNECNLSLGQRILCAMKLLFSLVAAVGLMAPALAAQSPVVVELFTSEGCSSCPPADALLVKLSQMDGPGLPQVIVLGEHVDYWNHIGWTDRFSSPQFSQRQDGYARHFGLASAYTPQMVIDGQRQLVGNDASGVGHQIDAAAKTEKPAKISVTQLTNGHYTVSVQAPNEKGKVLLAITEDSLSSEVKAGENSGRTLRHAGVVRELRTIGSLKNGSFDGTVDVPLKRDWNPANVKAVVFVQQGDFGPILGAAYLRISTNPSMNAY